jgi:hypothetical protein
MVRFKLSVKSTKLNLSRQITFLSEHSYIHMSEFKEKQKYVHVKESDVDFLLHIDG